MTNKTQPTAHAEIAAPISADLRGMPGLSEQDAGLLEQAASMLEGLQNDERNRGNCSTAEGAACSAHAVRRLAVQLMRAAPPAPAAVAVPELRLSDEQIEQAFISARDEFMLREVERTDKKLRLAFGRAVLHSARAALAAAPAQAVAVTAPTEALIDEPVTKQMIDAGAKAAREYMARTGGNNLTVIYRAMRAVAPAGGVSAAPAQEHATQLAGQGPWKDLGYGSEAEYAADMQAVGVALMETIKDNSASLQAAGWSRPADCPSEIVADLLDLIAEAKAAPAQAQEDAPVVRAGLLAAAAHIRAKASAHVEECGSYDPDTGAFEMRDAVQDHYNTLDELAEEIRLMAVGAAPESCDKPPAGWACSRAPGHVGPCAAARAAQGGA